MSEIAVVPVVPRPSAEAERGARPGVIVVSHVPPWPAAAGNEYRLARLLAWLGDAGYDAHLVYRPFPAGPITDQAVRELAARYPRTYVVDVERQTVRFATDVPAAYDAVVDLAGARPHRHDNDFPDDTSLEPRVLELTRSFAPDVLIDLVARLTAVLEPTAVIALYIFMSRVIAALPPTTIRMLDLIDVFSSKHDKVLRFGVDDSFAVSKSDEAYLLGRADVAIAIQDEEADAVRALAPDVRVITAGIDYPVVLGRRAPVPGRVLVVGSDNPLNKAGLAGFLRFAWPTVLDNAPDAQLVVVGSIGKSLSGAEPSVHILGRVDDLGDAYSSARVAINPTFAGTGVKVKTLEALAHLCPIVLWPSGTDGLSADVRACCSVADNWSTFARLVSAHLLSDDGQEDLASRSEQLSRALAADNVYRELADALSAAYPAGVG